MLKFGNLLLAAVAVLICSPAALAGKTRNVVLVISDGVRWQEVFSGADPTLLNEKEGGSWTPVAELRKKRRRPTWTSSACLSSGEKSW